LSRAAGLAIVAVAAAVASAAESPAGWTTYRSERFGYELSYPPDMELRLYLDGASGELREAATRKPLLELDLWPSDLCPRERAGTTAKGLGIERAIAVTQADGDDGSSWCGRPLGVREWVSPRGVPLYELELTCRGERVQRHRRVREDLGKKGPTFFADVSQPWRTRVLVLDPVGVDPRVGTVRPAVEQDIMHRIVDTVVAVPLPDPKTVCIDDLGPGARAIAAPVR
jgi:hypothetical protein